MKPYCEKCEQRTECVMYPKGKIEQKYEVIVNIYIDGDQIDQGNYKFFLCPGEADEVLRERVWGPIDEFETENHAYFYKGVTPMPKEEIPKDVLAALLRLESKQVLRGAKSEIFPDLTPELAKRFRDVSLQNLQKALEEAEKLGDDEHSDG